VLVLLLVLLLLLLVGASFVARPFTFVLYKFSEVDWSVDVFLHDRIFYLFEPFFF